jgi:hypothetical protein
MPFLFNQFLFCRNFPGFEFPQPNSFRVPAEIGSLLSSLIPNSGRRRGGRTALPQMMESGLI